MTWFLFSKKQGRCFADATGLSAKLFQSSHQSISSCPCSDFGSVVLEEQSCGQSTSPLPVFSPHGKLTDGKEQADYPQLIPHNRLPLWASLELLVAASLLSQTCKALFSCHFLRSALNYSCSFLSTILHYFKHPRYESSDVLLFHSLELNILFLSYISVLCTAQEVLEFLSLLLPCIINRILPIVGLWITTWFTVF